MITTGMFFRLTSWRAGSFCIQHTNRSGPSALVSRSIASSRGRSSAGHINRDVGRPPGARFAGANDGGLERRPSWLHCDDCLD